MSEDSQVRKDMAETYNEKLSHIIDEIEQCKKAMIHNKEAAYILAERLHSWFMKIYGKLKINNLEDDIKLFDEYSQKLKELGTPIFYNYQGNKTHKVINEKSMEIYQHYLELQERHLNFCMERLGLTNITKKSKRVT